MRLCAQACTKGHLKRAARAYDQRMRATAAHEPAREGPRSGRAADASPLVAEAARAARAPAALTAHAFGATARLAGNRAVAQLARRRTGGSPLPPAAPARRLLGPDA